MHISISDVRLFNRCRRKWDLTSPNRKNLGRASSEKDYFFIGTVVHRGLDMIAVGTYSTNVLESIFNEELEDYKARYERSLGVPISDVEVDTLAQHKELIFGMLDGYVKLYGLKAPLGDNFKYICSELSFEVPIPWSYRGFFRGTVDGLAYNKETGGFWIVEHKTYSRTPSLGDMMFDEQLRGYAWAIPKCTDIERVEGLIYDGMLKKLPTEPSVLKNGTMSTRKLDTTRAVYEAALRAAGLNLDDYKDHLETLGDGSNLFYNREYVLVSDSSLKEMQEHLMDAHFVMTGGPRIYPNRPYNSCWDCNVKSLCDSMTLNEGLEPADLGFVPMEPYGTFKATNPITPQRPLSLKELAGV